MAEDTTTSKATGAAALPGVFMPVHTISNWLPKEHADSVLDFMIKSQEQYTASQVYRKGEGHFDPDYRKSVVFRGGKEIKDRLREAVTAIKPELQKILGVPDFPARKIEVEFAAHGEGAHFERHVDTLNDSTGSTRILTLVYYLNREPKTYSGGHLRLYALNNQETKEIEPTHNLLVAFPAFAPHSVAEVHCPSGRFEDQRFAVNIWVHR